MTWASDDAAVRISEAHEGLVVVPIRLSACACAATLYRVDARTELFM
jgi:hypothetical protein